MPVRILGIIVLVLGTLVACATPQSFNERLLVGYETVAEVRSSTSTLLNARKIDSADAENVQKQANLAREGLDVAGSLASSQPAAAEAKLSAAQAVVRALKEYLATKGTK